MPPAPFGNFKTHLGSFLWGIRDGYGLGCQKTALLRCGAWRMSPNGGASKSLIASRIFFFSSALSPCGAGPRDWTVTVRFGVSQLILSQQAVHGLPFIDLTHLKHRYSSNVVSQDVQISVNLSVSKCLWTTLPPSPSWQQQWTTASLWNPMEWPLPVQML